MHLDLAQVFKTYKIPLVLGGGSIFLIAISIVLLVKSVQTTSPITFSGEASGSALGVQAMIAVDVEGAVNKPGLIKLPTGSRVEDAIDAAGGLSEEVDADLFSKNINRAMKLVDGGKLYVPKVGESITSHNITSYNNGDIKNNLVSINSASLSDLDSLPGVGPATAQKIIDNRPYQTLDELVGKKAIGSSLYEKLKNNLSL